MLKPICFRHSKQGLGFNSRNLWLGWASGIICLLLLLYVTLKHKGSASPTPISEVRPPVAAKSPLWHKAKKAVVFVTRWDARSIALRAIGKEYTCVFSGRVMCGDHPCTQADIKVHIESDKNPSLEKEATLLPDGSYSVAMTLRELPHAFVDWKITVASRQSASQVVQGRTILMDDPAVSILQPINVSQITL